MPTPSWFQRRAACIARWEVCLLQPSAGATTHWDGLRCYSGGWTGRGVWLKAHGALALAEPRGMRPLVAHGRFGLGKRYRRTGKIEQVRECLHGNGDTARWICSFG